MGRQLKPSSEVRASLLLQVQVDALILQDLEAHATEVLEVIGALNDYLNSSAPKSMGALVHARSLSRKLLMHMARLRDLINARKAAYALTQTMPAAIAHEPSSGPGKGRRSRVIRSLSSADNATPAPQGGEAKGAAHPQAGEAGLQAKR